MSHSTDVFVQQPFQGNGIFCLENLSLIPLVLADSDGANVVMAFVTFRAWPLGETPSTSQPSASLKWKENDTDHTSAEESGQLLLGDCYGDVENIK